MNQPSQDRHGSARRARFLDRQPQVSFRRGRWSPETAHRAVNLVIFLTIVSLGAWIIYGGSWGQVLLATVVIIILGLAWALSERFHENKRLRKMREETDRKRDGRFERGPFDWHGEP